VSTAERAAAEAIDATMPAVGQWTHRTTGQRVTITRVWTDGGAASISVGIAVAYEWRDDKPGQAGSACPLRVFLGTYKPAEQPAAPVDPWPIVARLTAWLDSHNGRSSEETGLRLLKVAEESGEVARAWIGTAGQNPRKGVTHTTGDVADELCDVITAAMVALTTITNNPADYFKRKLDQIAALRLDGDA
jgi:NTP pyrophosphatase (non-canonical NTP hydrolase)